MISAVSVSKLKMNQKKLVISTGINWRSVVSVCGVLAMLVA